MSAELCIIGMGKRYTATNGVLMDRAEASKLTLCLTAIIKLLLQNEPLKGDTISHLPHLMFQYLLAGSPFSFTYIMYRVV